MLQIIFLTLIILCAIALFMYLYKFEQKRNNLWNQIVQTHNFIPQKNPNIEESIVKDLDESRFLEELSSRHEIVIGIDIQKIPSIVFLQIATGDILNERAFFFRYHPGRGNHPGEYSGMAVYLKRKSNAEHFFFTAGRSGANHFESRNSNTGLHDKLDEWVQKNNPISIAFDGELCGGERFAGGELFWISAKQIKHTERVLQMAENFFETIR